MGREEGRGERENDAETRRRADAREEKTTRGRGERNKILADKVGQVVRPPDGGRFTCRPGCIPLAGAARRQVNASLKRCNDLPYCFTGAGDAGNV